MINETALKVPKKYHNAIDQIYKEDNYYWVHLKEGYNVDGFGIIHEKTQKETLDTIRCIEKVKN